MAEKLAIRYVPLAEATRWNRNPKLHDLEAIKGSIRRHGFRDAPIFDDALDAVAAGNGRLDALEDLKAEGDEPPRGVVLRKKDGEWMVPIQFGLSADSAAKAEAFGLDHNNLTVAVSEDADIPALYDQRALAQLLEGRENEFEMPVSFGFDELDVLLADLRRQDEEEIDIPAPDPHFEKAEQLAREWGVEPGQVWKLGEHRLMVGDATDPESVEKLLDGEVPLLMVTDPPYGVAYDPNWRTEAELTTWGPVRRTGKVDNDDRSDWTEAWKLFPGDVAYVWHSALHSSDVARHLMACGFLIRAQIIWKKPFAPISRGHYHWQHEPCWYVVRKGATSRWCGDRKQTTVWDLIPPGDRYHVSDEPITPHGTQKPIEAMARPIRNHGEPGIGVYDPFLGSGTTLLACEALGRRFFGLDLEPAYIGVTLDRWKAAGYVDPELLEG